MERNCVEGVMREGGMAEAESKYSHDVVVFIPLWKVGSGSLFYDLLLYYVSLR